MKERLVRKIINLQKTGLSVLFVFLTAVSCVPRKDKIEQANLIPEKTFVSILTDVYIANGLLTLPEVRYTFIKRDSVSNFVDIIKSYGYSYEAMNSTMNYYFISKPKKLIRIYDQIIRRMSEMESGYQNELTRIQKEASRASANYSIFSLPDPVGKKLPEFSRDIDPPGIFTLSFSITLYPDDQSFKPHFTAWFCDADSIETGKKRWFTPFEYIKDGYLHMITYTGRIEEDRKMVLKVILYDYENNIMEWDKHARIEVLFFNFFADAV
jgi:hypothetical protein